MAGAGDHKIKEWCGRFDRYRHSRRSCHSELRRSIYSPGSCRCFHYATGSRRIAAAADESRNGNGTTDRLPSRYRGARDGIMAGLPLHYYQSISRRRFAQIPAHHGRGGLFEPTSYSKVVCRYCMEKNARPRSDKTTARKGVRIRPDTKSTVLGITDSTTTYQSAELSSRLVKH